jgi:hypothetical protein
LLQAWDAILTTVDPDLIVADYAPAASMMARGRIPLIVVGNGYTVPPGDMKRFPLLHRVHPPRWSEDETLATVNRVLRSLDRPPLKQLPQMFSGDAQMVLTFPVLDPYDLQRSSPLAGPIFDSPPLEARMDANSIFVYLSRGVLSAPTRSAGLSATFAIERDAGIHTARDSFRRRRAGGSRCRGGYPSTRRGNSHRAASERASAQKGTPRKGHR